MLINDNIAEMFHK